MKLTKTLASACAALALLSATPALAQQDQPAEITADSVTEEQVNAFAIAFISVEQVRREYQPQIAEQDSEDGRRVLMKQASAKAIGMVQRVPGITPAQYQQIAILAKTEPALDDRIKARIGAIIEANKKPEQNKAE